MPELQSTWRRVVERLLPWYSPKEEAERQAKSEQIRLNAISARLKAERIREDYARMDARLRGRR